MKLWIHKSNARLSDISTHSFDRVNDQVAPGECETLKLPIPSCNLNIHYTLTVPLDQCPALLKAAEQSVRIVKSRVDVKDIRRAILLGKLEMFKNDIGTRLGVLPYNNEVTKVSQEDLEILKAIVLKHGKEEGGS